MSPTKARRLAGVRTATPDRTTLEGNCVTFPAIPASQLPGLTEAPPHPAVLVLAQLQTYRLPWREVAPMAVGGILTGLAAAMLASRAVRPLPTPRGSYLFVVAGWPS